MNLQNLNVPFFSFFLMAQTKKGTESILDTSILQIFRVGGDLIIYLNFVKI